MKELKFDMPGKSKSIIKIVGVGGCGGNIISSMNDDEHFKKVELISCNTDIQALDYSSIMTKIQLGEKLTKGNGSGGNPDIGRQATEESIDQIERKIFADNPQMIFIIAGMGGGTGTGGAPVISKIAKKKGIFTVGIITTPYTFEGSKRKEQANKGIEKMKKYVDSILVLDSTNFENSNTKLSFRTCFKKGDKPIIEISKNIVNIILSHNVFNVDINDVRSILADQKNIIFGLSKASGENRADTVIENALDYPFMKKNIIKEKKNVFLIILSGEQEISVQEINTITEKIKEKAGTDINIVSAIGEDMTLKDEIEVTLLATGERQKVIKQKSPRYYDIQEVPPYKEEEKQTPQRVIKESVTSPDEKTFNFQPIDIIKDDSNLEFKEEVDEDFHITDFEQSKTLSPKETSHLDLVNKPIKQNLVSSDGKEYINLEEDEYVDKKYNFVEGASSQSQKIHINKEIKLIEKEEEEDNNDEIAEDTKEKTPLNTPIKEFFPKNKFTKITKNIKAFTEKQKGQQRSDTTISIDKNNEIQMRNNNSRIHAKVD